MCNKRRGYSIYGGRVVLRCTYPFLHGLLNILLIVVSSCNYAVVFSDFLLGDYFFVFLPKAGSRMITYCEYNTRQD